MQKIHRRKNQDISKEFLCPQNCGKAYGSYAALYTHIKNKHPTAKPPEMKSGHIKSKEPPRKSKAENFKIIHENSENVDYDCKSCRQKDCICFEEINEADINLNIALLSDQTFIKFVHCIGQLYVKDKFMWTRNTEEHYLFFNRQALRELARNFSSKYHQENDRGVEFSNKWLDYLSLSSKYWDRRYISELYSAILLILSKQSSKEVQNFFHAYGHEGEQFQNISKCIAAKPKQWGQFVQLIKIL